MAVLHVPSSAPAFDATIAIEQEVTLTVSGIGMVKKRMLWGYPEVWHGCCLWLSGTGHVRVGYVGASVLCVV